VAKLADCQFEPPELPPHPEQESTVRAPVTVTAPLNLLSPRTPKVVEGEAVPTPTLFSLAFTTKTSVLKTPESEKVEVLWVMESSWVPLAETSMVFAADE